MVIYLSPPGNWILIVSLSPPTITLPSGIKMVKPRIDIVHNQFTMVTKGKDYYNDTVSCNNCGSKLKRNVTKLRNHLTRACHAITPLEKQKFLKNPAAGNHRGTLSQDQESSATVSTAPAYSPISSQMVKLSQTVINKTKKSMARAIYTNAIPFKFVTNKYFRECAEAIGAPNMFPTIHELRFGLLDEVFNEDVSERMKMIQKAQCLSLALDCSTNVRGLPVISINAHTPG